MTAYGLPNAGSAGALTGALFQDIVNPFAGMPLVAVADLGALPTSIGPGASLSAWTTGWPDGGPAWVAQPYENEASFKQRIVAACKAAGMVGVVVNVWQQGGFWPINQNGTQLVAGGISA